MQSVHIERSNSADPDFIRLVEWLDRELAIRDGDAEHAFYDQFNKIDQIKHAVIAYYGETPVGCGALKAHESGSMEIKRMFVAAQYRGKGIADQMIGELENWAREMSYTRCILETGKRQSEALRFYQKKGYKRIPNYGQYAGIENSLCFEKKLN